MTQPAENRRILLVDDNQSIHDDFRKILSPADAAKAGGLDDARAAFLGAAAAPAKSDTACFELSSALQGQEAHDVVRTAMGEGRPFAMAFVDMRMPPGWDGVETIQKLWELDPELQVVICTAFSDYSWEETVSALGVTDRLLILKKPFDAIEIRQLASALTEKWNARAREKRLIEELTTAEREVRAYATSLETVNRAMITSRAVADRAAEARNELLMHISNEVGKHLEVVVKQADAFRDGGPADATHLRDFEAFVDASTELVRRIDEVLDMTRMESGRTAVELAPCSVREIAERVAERHRADAEAKGLTFTCECSDALPELVAGEPGRMEQVLDHLLENAVRFTEQGSVALIVECDHMNGPAHPRVRFSIEDTGPGIPKERLGDLFEPLERDADHGGGSGFGLAIAQRIAYLLGGEIKARSNAGEGSTFTLTLDLDVTDQRIAA